MNNAEVIKGIEMTISGLTAIKNALADNATQETPAVKKTVEKKDVPVMNEPVATGKFDVEQLNSMKYNEFKKLAASLGVKCTGTRDEIMQRILALDVTVEDDSTEVSDTASVEKTEEVTETKSDRPATGKRKLAKKADEPVKDEFDEQAEKIASDTPIEDIIEALADVDVKATKKNAVAKLAEALRNGLIEVDDDEDEDDEVEDIDEEDEDFDGDEDSEDEEDDSDEDEGEDFTADTYFPEVDPDGLNDPDTMSDERRQAVHDKNESILESFNSGELTFETITDFFNEYATEEDMELIDTENDLEVLALYIALNDRLIDNDGDEHEKEDPYEVGEHDMCCGHELKYVKKTKKYICEVCGAEYEAE